MNDSFTTLADGELPNEIIDLLFEQFKKPIVSEIDLHHPVGSNWVSLAARINEGDVTKLYRVRVVDMDLNTVICRAEVTEITTEKEMLT